jgi:hypothetical protein
MTDRLFGFFARLTTLGIVLLFALAVLWEIAAIGVGVTAFNVVQGDEASRLLWAIGIWFIISAIGALLVVLAFQALRLLFWLITGDDFLR